MNPFAPRSPTAGENLANALTHGLGFGLCAAGLVLLFARAAGQRDPWTVVSCSVYGATLLLLYGTSTAYHSVREGRLRNALHRIDHASIFLLIAGTYTPYTLGPLRGPWGWSMFGAIWGLALLGVALKCATARPFQALSLAAYVGMGWLVAIALRPLLRVLPPAGVGWLLAGGLCYTAGIVFYAWKRLPYGHMVWHLFVLAGSLCHFFGILFYVVKET